MLKIPIITLDWQKKNFERKFRELVTFVLILNELLRKSSKRKQICEFVTKNHYCL